MTQNLLKCLNIEKNGGLSNHELQLFNESPASYIWNRTAPSDPNKVGTSDMGTTLHAFLLEPNTYEDQVDVASVKGRNTVAFQKHQYKAATY